jgi:hypothetical protein
MHWTLKNQVWVELERLYFNNNNNQAKWYFILQIPNKPWCDRTVPIKETYINLL